MKTIPLEEALTLAASRPITPKQHGQILTSRAEQIAVVTDRLQIEAGSTVGNAALLAHFYNHGPELVSLLGCVLDAVNKQPFGKHPFPDSRGGITNGSRLHTELESLLSKASTVQMP